MKKKKPPKTIEEGLKRLDYRFRLCWDAGRWKIWYYRDDVGHKDYHTGRGALSAIRNACKAEGV